MTDMTNTLAPGTAVIGPFSQWPRAEGPRQRWRRRRIALWTGAVAFTGVFVHCAVPMIVGV